MKGEGSPEDPWTSWYFVMKLYIPLLDDPNGTLEMVADLLGMGGDQGNITEELEYGDMLEGLEESKMRFFARGYASNGSWGQDSRDITMMLMVEVGRFALSEGWIDADDLPFPINPGDDDDEGDPDTDESDKEGFTTFAYVLMGAGGLFVLAGVIIAVVLMLSKRR